MNILVTGATGFFGIHMVFTLLSNTDASLFLLIRCESPESGKARFHELWNYYFPDKNLRSFEGRLHFVSGDLSHERLGLDTAAWESLSLSIDTIIHAGANVRHYGLFEEFVKTNINGTKTLIEFAKSGCSKVLHYISTVSLHLLNKPDGLGYFFEDDFPEEPHLENNYLKSKWEAELLLRTSGINVRFYRLGNLVGHSETGKFQINEDENAFRQSIRAFMELGAVPHFEEAFIDISYVDQAAEAVMKLMLAVSPLYTFHIFNPHRISFHDLALSLDLELVEIERFMHLYDHNKQLATYTPYLKNPELLMTYPVNDQTEAVLKKIGHKWKKPYTKNLNRVVY